MSRLGGHVWDLETEKHVLVARLGVRGKEYGICGS